MLLSLFMLDVCSDVLSLSPARDSLLSGRSRFRLGNLSANQEDWAIGGAYDGVRHATQECAPEANQSMGAHDDQIR